MNRESRIEKSTDSLLVTHCSLNCGRIAQQVRASVLQTESRRFDSFSDYRVKAKLKEIIASKAGGDEAVDKSKSDKDKK